MKGSNSVGNSGGCSSVLKVKWVLEQSYFPAMHMEVAETFLAL